MTMDAVSPTSGRESPVYFEDIAAAADYGAPHDIAAHFMRRDTKSAGGAHDSISYGRHDCRSLGPVTIAMVGEMICRIMPGDDEAAAIAELRARWPGARLMADRDASRDAARCMDAYWTGTASRLDGMAVRLDGTPFQLSVWHALLQIPMGTCVSYSAIARAVGVPGAARAVGVAVAANPVALLIPCHRVIRAGGDIGNYAWGAGRKRALLSREAALCNTIPGSNA